MQDTEPILEIDDLTVMRGKALLNGVSWCIHPGDIGLCLVRMVQVKALYSTW